jgi:hypothetical protein
MKPANPHHVILESLSLGEWLAPHEIELQLKLSGVHISSAAVSSRMRDLRKPQYGRHKLVKRMRPGTGYFEYTIVTSRREGRISEQSVIYEAV